jgi:hypothetical protein
MTQAIIPTESTDIVERVLLAGDLSKLTPQERVTYYAQTCKSLGLNPLTRPFEYIILNNKLTLYARKDCTDQLRNLKGISIGKPDIQTIDDLIIVTVEATDKTGRKDSDLGVVRKSDMRGDLANAMMKAVTKAKRRVTLSICGLGMLDETEVETIPDARPAPHAEVSTKLSRDNGAGGDTVMGQKPVAPELMTARSDYKRVRLLAKERGIPITPGETATADDDTPTLDARTATLVAKVKAFDLNACIIEASEDPLSPGK